MPFGVVEKDHRVFLPPGCLLVKLSDEVAEEQCPHVGVRIGLGQGTVEPTIGVESCK